MRRDVQLSIPISPGELFDRISILQIKTRRIGDETKRRNVAHELALLEQVSAQCVPTTAQLETFVAELMGVNESLWEIEDAIRECEARRDFGPTFVELARSVYRTNDRRGKLKAGINEILGSELREEKSYAHYSGEPAADRYN